MLKAAAERGVEVRVIVYKEVKAALSCKWFDCIEYLPNSSVPN